MEIRYSRIVLVFEHRQKKDSDHTVLFLFYTDLYTDIYIDFNLHGILME